MRRAELRESDVKHKRLTWDELQREIDWVSCGWGSRWERRAEYVCVSSPSYLLTVMGKVWVQGDAAARVGGWKERVLSGTGIVH